MESKALIELAVKLLTLLLRCRKEGLDITLSYDPGRRFDLSTRKMVQKTGGWEIEVGGIAYTKYYPSLLEATNAGTALLEVVMRNDDYKY